MSVWVCVSQSLVRRCPRPGFSGMQLQLQLHCNLSRVRPGVLEPHFEMAQMGMLAPSGPCHLSCPKVRKCWPCQTQNSCACLADATDMFSCCSHSMLGRARGLWIWSLGVWTGRRWNGGGPSSSTCRQWTTCSHAAMQPCSRSVNPNSQFSSFHRLRAPHARGTRRSAECWTIPIPIWLVFVPL